MSDQLVVRVDGKLIHLIDALSSLHDEMQGLENTFFFENGIFGQMHAF